MAAVAGSYYSAAIFFSCGESGVSGYRHGHQLKKMRNGEKRENRDCMKENGVVAGA
jgi:hypothetical protein